MLFHCSPMGQGKKFKFYLKKKRLKIEKSDSYHSQKVVKWKSLELGSDFKKNFPKYFY